MKKNSSFFHFWRFETFTGKPHLDETSKNRGTWKNNKKNEKNMKTKMTKNEIQNEKHFFQDEKQMKMKMKKPMQEMKTKTKK